jgi:N-acetylglucosaminyldiphosphoundecaprenol N-acetyl-beta-D-mannosaminyltransferase/alpha-1,3-mannosyltransferase
MHTFNVAEADGNFAAALNQGYVFNDGLGMDIASRILYGSKFPSNLNGTDLTPLVLNALPEQCRVFLLGSKSGIAELAAIALGRRFPNIEVVGARDGYFAPEEALMVAQTIRATKPDLVLVGMGNPAQELWAARYGADTGAVLMCVGAFIDFTAGRFARAPRLVQRLRLEWLYRMALEPRRLMGRYIGGIAPFLIAILREKYRNAKL